MKHHNGCKHKDKVSGNCKLKATGIFTAFFGGGKCAYPPLYKFKCYEQEERPEVVPPASKSKATFTNCEFIDCTFITIKDEPKTELEMLQEKYEENRRDYIHRIRSCFDLHTEEYFILVKMENVWLPLVEFYITDREKHMVHFNLLAERIKSGLWEYK